MKTTSKASKNLKPAYGKRRIRKHVIADISFHHLALIVVRCGYTIQEVARDYGYDASVITYDKDGSVENSPFWIQLKATDELDLDEAGRIRFQLKKQDIRLWTGNPFPVYLVVYDAKDGTAYWLYLQRYFKEIGVTADTMTRESRRVFIDRTAVVDHQTIVSWRDHKNRQLSKMLEIDHD